MFIALCISLYKHLTNHSCKKVECLLLSRSLLLSIDLILLQVHHHHPVLFCHDFDSHSLLVEHRRNLVDLVEVEDSSLRI